MSYLEILDYSYFIVMIAIVLISLLTLIIKRGIHSICCIVIASYASFNYLSGVSGISDSEYYLYDIVRLAGLSICLLICSKMSCNIRHYFYYSVVIISQMILSFLVLINIYNELFFNTLYMIVTLSELAVFFNGIYRTITADNSKGSAFIFDNHYGRSFDLYRYRAVCRVNSLQKGDRK